MQGILQPLNRLGEQFDFPRCLIVIDSICEAEVHRSENGHSLASFLVSHAAEFPSWLKLIITVRNEESCACLKEMPFHKMK